jgi:hypothetical protein
VGDDKLERRVARSTKPVQLGLPGAAARVEGVLEGEVVRVTYENEHTGFRVLRVAVEGSREGRTCARPGSG